MDSRRWPVSNSVPLRPECCGSAICGFLIAGCTVELNYHRSATRSGQRATGTIPSGLPGGSALPAASLDSRRAFIMFCQCARIEDDGSRVQMRRSCQLKAGPQRSCAINRSAKTNKRLISRLLHHQIRDFSATCSTNHVFPDDAPHADILSPDHVRT